jgi:hypothetical protein
MNMMTRSEREDLELCYLGRLAVRVEAPRVIVDLGFVYACERLLAHRAWPAYTRVCANNAGYVLALVEPPRGGPWKSGLAIFSAEGWPSLRSLVVLNDGRLIAWDPGEEPDSLRIRIEREHTESMWALIEQAARESPSASVLDLGPPAPRRGRPP